MRCAANEQCLVTDSADEPQDQYDRYTIYAGKWHETCWDKYGYKEFVFDPSYAGERLEEDD